jgi:CDP-glucose 4,6-dehydratase
MGVRQRPVEGLAMIPNSGVAPKAAIDRHFWSGRRVFMTGHTGFKGSWLTAWLYSLGAEVTGLSLGPPTSPSLFEAVGLRRFCADQVGDIRDLDAVRRALTNARAEVVLHLAAQPIVRTGYQEPVGTYETNIMGTVNVLEAVRTSGLSPAVVVVTSDKCYENREWPWGYREEDRLGGHDPYSSSKAAAELVSSAYRLSYFSSASIEAHGVAVATARAGNVIGGGDWAPDRLVPDAVRSLVEGHPVQVRNPAAIRPWQHVVESLRGYLMLAQALSTQGQAVGSAFNFGPDELGVVTVGQLMDRFVAEWGHGASWETLGRAGDHHEAGMLKLDPSLAGVRLGWRPAVGLDEAVAATVLWYRLHAGGASSESLLAALLGQIETLGMRAA